IVQMALSPPPAGRTRWTTRLIGDDVDLTSATVAKVLRANGLKPHLVRTYKVSRDPEFAAKVTDVVGLYLNPPQNAIVLSADEKTSRTVRARPRSASTSTRTSRIGTTTRLPSSGRNRPLRSSARGSECLIGSHMRCTRHRSPRRFNVGTCRIGSRPFVLGSNRESDPCGRLSSAPRFPWMASCKRPAGRPRIRPRASGSRLGDALFRSRVRRRARPRLQGEIRPPARPQDLRDFRRVLALLRRRSPWRHRQAVQRHQEVRGFALRRGRYELGGLSAPARHRRREAPEAGRRPEPRHPGQYRTRPRAARQ